MRQANRFICEDVVYVGDVEIMRRKEIYIDGEKKNATEEREIKIAYLCDRRACSFCNAGCGYTTDIQHAKNFKREGTIMIDG